MGQYTHDHHHPDSFAAPSDVRRIPRIGIGGPVGSGKTALIERLVPMLLAAGYPPLVITNDIYTQEDAEHVRRTLDGVIDARRVIGVETGCCPHTAVRDDPTLNLAAALQQQHKAPPHPGARKAGSICCWSVPAR